MARRIRRRYRFEYRLTCYYCGNPDEIVYQSQWSEASQVEEKDEDEWTTSFVIWRDRMERGIEEFLNKAARKKCSSYGRKPGTICARWEMRGLEFEEEIIEVEIPKVIPKWVLDVIELLEKRKEEAETIDEKEAIQEEIDRYKKRYGIE